MLSLLATSLAALYLLCALCLLIYTSGHGVLLWQIVRQGRRPKRQQGTPLPGGNAQELPAVLVQLPIYNEQHVIVRLLNAVAALDYPPEKLHIQILDDSSDHTTSLIAQHIRQLPALHIEHIRRPIRSGYKAGALAHGLEQTDAPFVAIFDADFVPPPDFLRRTLPCLLADDSLGVVQTRWGHLNPGTNLLTRAQVLSIDAHFLIEQAGRDAAGWPLPFNGTGGVWRTETIHAAGGWSSATLTEDLDLSLRAQLKGWRAMFLPDVVVPGELPPQLAAYRQQQMRWAQGSSQNLRRFLLPLWASSLSTPAKFMATHFLAQYLPQLWMLLLLLLVPPLLVLGALPVRLLAPLGFISLIPPLLYFASQHMQGRGWERRLLALPALILLSTGLVARNSLAVLRGLSGRAGDTAFLRTPKFAQDWQGSAYAMRSAFPLVEVACALYASWGAYLAVNHAPPLLPYLLLHVFSFSAVALREWQDSRRLRHSRGLLPLLAEGRND